MQGDGVQFMSGNSTKVEEVGGLFFADFLCTGFGVHPLKVPNTQQESALKPVRSFIVGGKRGSRIRRVKGDNYS